MSATKALPPSQMRPPKHGRTAKASGREFHVLLVGTGRMESSEEERKVVLALGFSVWLDRRVVVVVVGDAISLLNTKHSLGNREAGVKRCEEERKTLEVFSC